VKTPGAPWLQDGSSRFRNKWQKTGEFAEFVSCILDPGLQSQETEFAENWEKL
jgi:hypothetical protein